MKCGLRGSQRVSVTKTSGTGVTSGGGVSGRDAPEHEGSRWTRDPDVGSQ